MKTNWRHDVSQIFSGLRFGNGFSVLFGTADPNSATAPDDIQRGVVDYAYFRLGTGSATTWLYRCSKSAVIQSGAIVAPAVWTAGAL
jgi:hypothetical protein